jgi:hypothetical protein
MLGALENAVEGVLGIAEPAAVSEEAVSFNGEAEAAGHCFAPSVPAVYGRLAVVCVVDFGGAKALGVIAQPAALR